MGDSILRSVEGPICRPDLVHREVCCLPGAQVKDPTAKLPTLVRPKDYYPLLVYQVGSDDITRRSPKSMKRDFRSLWKVVKRSGAQTVVIYPGAYVWEFQFCPLPPSNLV